MSSSPPSPDPPFDPRGSRYDQSTFSGRLSHFREMTDPSTLFTSGRELTFARDVLARHSSASAAGGGGGSGKQRGGGGLSDDLKLELRALRAKNAKGDELDKDEKKRMKLLAARVQVVGTYCQATDAELWEAKRVVDAVVHPVTGEEMFLAGRMSAFVPANTIPTAGMLLARSPAATVFWQWINQSVNVMCNYVNRSGATIDTAQVAQAYALAVGVSCGIAVGAKSMIAKAPPSIAKLGIAVPYAAVVCAGAANVGFTRLPEMQSGVSIAAPDGTPLGSSKAAAREAVTSTILSRCVLLPIAPMLLPPLAMTAIASAVTLGPAAAVVAEVGLVAGSIYGALPLAIAVFPQEMKIATSALEVEFQNAVDAAGDPIEYVVCNKGL